MSLFACSVIVPLLFGSPSVVPALIVMPLLLPVISERLVTVDGNVTELPTVIAPADVGLPKISVVALTLFSDD